MFLKVCKVDCCIFEYCLMFMNWNIDQIGSSNMETENWLDLPDDIFHEEYEPEEDSESDGEPMDNEELENISYSAELGNCALRLGISDDQAQANYDAAGREIEEETDRITVADNEHLMDAATNEILDEIVSEIEMPYNPAEFQRVAINALGQMKNVILGKLSKKRK